MRLYKINIPLADHHSWRQSDSASVIRNLANGKFDIFRPQWDNLTPTNAKSLPNPNRYFFEDFPLSFDVYPALLNKIFGPDIRVLRLFPIFISLLTIYLLGLLVAEITNKRIGVIAALIYAILPYSIFFSRGIFQEIALNFYAVGGFYCLIRYFKSQNKYYFILSILLNALLFLTKPYALVFLFPESVLFYQNYKKGLIKIKQIIYYSLFSLIPFFAWWLWVLRFPEGIPGSTWLLNEGDIRFKGSFFHWIFAERIGKLILGYYGLIFVGLGALFLNYSKDSLFYSWTLALLIYVVIIAKGNVTHDYYQIPFLPVIAYFFAKGIDIIFSFQKKRKEKFAGIVLILIFIAFSFAFSWYETRGFYNLKSGVDLAGDFVDKNLPSSALIIVGDGADPTLLYNCNRRGWTIGYGSGMENSKATIETLIQKNASYYVATINSGINGTSFNQYLKDNFSLIKETDQYIIFKLTD